MHKLLSLTLIFALSVMAHGQRRSASVSQQQFDVIIKGGTVYNGTGRAPVKADVGLKGNRIAAVGNLSRATAPSIIDANIVPPGTAVTTNTFAAGRSSSCGRNGAESLSALFRMVMV